MTEFKMSRAVTAAVVAGAGATLVLAGCSSNSNSSSDASATAETPTATNTGSTTTINPPSGSKQISNEAIGDATYTRYSTSKTPKDVVSFYDGEFKSANYTITSEGGGGGGWGNYGGSDAGISANNGSSSFVAVHAGAEKGATTYFEVCAGPSSQSVEKCQQSNHSSSNQS